MMNYKITRNEKYDFKGQSYSSLYPNLHKYPATMLPQIGIEILRELNISSGKLLDPYCGSGSSFASGLECGLREMSGFDINPLAVLISSVKFTKINLKKLISEKNILRKNIYEFLKNEKNIFTLPPPQVTNIDFWFSKNVTEKLSILKFSIDKINNKQIRNFFLVPFSETVRECSYTRNNEFKLFRMKNEDILSFNPDVISIFLKKLDETISSYENYYLPNLKDDIKIDIQYSKFEPIKDSFDVVLTSPPYGDSKTTVAYGQFSSLSNEWMGIDYARKIDGMLMGGTKYKTKIENGVISEPICQIAKVDEKRSREVTSFYIDLEKSIKQVADSIKKGGKTIYVVGNRTVKNIRLPTDQFIAEKFEENGFSHLVTYERALSNKTMPTKNSPTNKIGNTVGTMLMEYIVVCEKTQ